MTKLKFLNKIGRPLIPVIWLIFFSTNLISSAYAASPDADVLVTVTKYVTMSLAVSLSCIAAGAALSKTGAASVASVTEKPELFGRTMVYVGMAEGIAIYGLLIAFLIWVD